MLKITRTAIIVSLSMATPSFAQQATTPADALVRQLTNQGFTVTKRGRTWLGRTVITAHKGALEREIVVARGSGQILQDDWVFGAENGANATSEDEDENDDESESPGGNGISGGNGNGQSGGNGNGQSGGNGNGHGGDNGNGHGGDNGNGHGGDNGNGHGGGNGNGNGRGGGRNR
ncbi:hypothetical protein GCM10008927_19370 [Amylibacter ulvae]|uniref:Uncharacterized protein n=1 Tax=Paramylibacter ulvae TaxID=1651968 RepID=A0ABQ3D2P9_9RHOB|nr:hypothetical protein [Amylibacter ulvae]GHA53638.1 hypothetical protein GCM10008927_19370 [Amylibacter ulvae]